MLLFEHDPLIDSTVGKIPAFFFLVAFLFTVGLQTTSAFGESKSGSKPTCKYNREQGSLSNCSHQELADRLSGVYSDEEKKSAMNRLLNDDDTPGDLKQTDLDYQRRSYWEEYLKDCQETPSLEKCGLNDIETAHANKGVSLSAFGIATGSQVKNVESLMRNIINLLSRVIGSTAVLTIMIGGMVLIVSTGDETLQTRGKEIIRAGIIAVVAVLGSYMVVSTVLQIIYSLGK